MSFSNDSYDAATERPRHDVDEGTEHYDSSGYCPVQLFETEFISAKSIYIPLRKIANGRFSTVYLCRDINMKRYVAVKVCQSGLDVSISEDEVRILQQVERNCKNIEDNGGIVRILDSFLYRIAETHAAAENATPQRGFFCIVFELLGHSVYRLLTRYTPSINYNKAIPMPIVKTITKNLLQSVHFLHHEAKIIHTDLKPENLAMVYYLPLLNEHSNYDLAELIYGPQAQQIFDAKLCTPASQVNVFDYKMQDGQTKQELRHYLTRLAAEQAIEHWHDIKDAMMDQTDYKAKFANFVKLRGSAEASANVSCYYIDGMNIFNLPNLVRTAETIFRLQPLPTNFWYTYEDLVIEQNTAGGRKVELFDAKSVLQSYETAALAGCTLEKHNYLLLPQKHLLKDKMLFLADNGIKFALSYVENNYCRLDEILAHCSIEKLICDLKQAQTIVKSAKAGLHSRVQLKALVNSANEYALSNLKNECVRHQMKVPDMNNQSHYKCFGLTDHGYKIYPTMISYYSKKQLIPFCPEMFKIKIIDLGNACYLDKRFSSVIQTVNYRAPEIIVGHKAYDYKVDEFSVGCIIFELLTGNVLFNPRRDGEYDSLYHLRQIVQTVGEEGLEWLAEKCTKTDMVQVDKSGNQCFKNMSNLQFRSIATQLVNDYGFEKEIAISVEQLIQPLLRLNPNERAQCADMLHNSWLNTLGQGDFLVGYDGRQ